MVSSIVRVIIFTVIVSIVVGFVGIINFSWSLDTSPYLQGLASFLHVIYYIIPIGKLSPVIICFIGLMSFRIIISIVKTLWQLIPISG